MSLSFLVPLFLLGLAGIAVPVILHLTRRQRRKVVAFPSLMFLRRVPYQEQRRRRVEHWALLALRALALGILALAFARPFLDDPAVAAAGGGGPAEVVVLVDRSYSMGVGGQWRRAQEAAREVFGRLGPLDRASLVFFDQGALVAVRSTSDPGRLRGAVDTARVGWGSTRYGPALKVAGTILEESQLPGREVVLITDFQAAGWRSEDGARLPSGTRVTPVPVREESGDNALVADVALARQSAGGRERVTATARVARSGGTGPRDVRVALELDGQEIQARTVRLEPGAAAPVPFDPFTLSGPHTRGTVRLSSDDLPADDARHFVLSPGTSVSVLLLEGGRAPRDAAFYLRRALETTSDGRFAVTVRRGDGPGGDDLEGADLVVLLDARVDGGSARALRAHVEGGGGLLLVGGEAASWPASEASLLPGAFGSVEERAEGRGGRIGFLDLGHPVFEVFSGPRSGDFGAARFFRARAFTGGDSARVVARFDDGSVALAEHAVGRGLVAVWTSTLDALWSDLALQPVFLPFVHRLAEHLSGRAEPFPWFAAGQVLDLADPRALRAAGLVPGAAPGLEEGEDQVAFTPAGSTLPLEAAAGPRYLSLDEAGFYVVRPPGREPERAFAVAVNPDLGESDLVGMDPQELVAQVRPLPAEQGGGSGGRSFEAAGLRRVDQERRQGLWRYLFFAAFALLLVETGVSNWMSRRRGAGPAGPTGGVDPSAGGRRA